MKVLVNSLSEAIRNTKPTKIPLTSNIDAARDEWSSLSSDAHSAAEGVSLTNISKPQCYMNIDSIWKDPWRKSQIKYGFRGIGTKVVGTCRYHGIPAEMRPQAF